MNFRGGGSSLHLRIEKNIAASLACSVAMNDTRFKNQSFRVLETMPAHRI